ncbi:Very-long-chain [Picochlorum sp. SENEW3]|nr:Very-long-chain [Picochlorum sp. SENEW3]
MNVKQAYLFSYNAALCSGWAYVFIRMVMTCVTAVHSGLSLTSPTTLSLVWESVQVPLKVSQSVAIMEVLHAAFGIVRSPVMITATQVASRLWILWGIVCLVPEATTTSVVSLTSNTVFSFELSLITLLTAWCLSEMIRYGFFACKEANMQPYIMVWLRYSGFLVLYPLGVSSELAMVWLALPVIRMKKPLSIELPNPVNFSISYDVVCILAVAAYLPGFPQLYGYMLKQRKKTLSSTATAADVTKKKNA